MFVIIVALYLCFFNKSDYSFELNSKNKYKIETDMQWITMQNDGVSHTNIYYNADFDNNDISKVEEIYQANLGGKPKITISKIYEKEIDFNLQKDLKSLLDEIMEKEDINESKNYNCFIISTLNNEKRIYNINTIKKINNILKLIDEL
jgi:transcriptional regulator of heat shock response